MRKIEFVETKDTNEYALCVESTEPVWREIGDDGKKGPPLYSAMLKWDGCCHIWFGSMDGEPDYVHTDELPELIATLQELHRLGVEHFKKTGKGVDGDWGSP